MSAIGPVRAPGDATRHGVPGATVAMVLWVLASVAAADPPAAPLPTANRHPFVQVLGLPAARGAAVLGPGEAHLRATLDVANTSIYAASGAREAADLIIDGETSRLELTLRRGLGGGWESTATVPLLRHDGGVLDRPIEEWHGVFGLPNGGRDTVPRNTLRYSYRARGEQLQVTEGVTGIGDLQLGLARALGDGLTLRAQVNLPTGEADELTGAGAAGLAASLHYSSAVTARGLYAHASAGALFREDGDLLPASRETLLGYGSLTLGWTATPRWHLKAQLDAHSAAWDSPREALGEPSAQLVLGASAALTDAWTLDIAFSEDITVERSPDIVFLLGLRWRGGR